MVKKKGKSKRITLKDKYKIQKRVIESHRKSRKQAKRDAASGKVLQNKKKKDPGIPNSWPFKAELLQDIAREKVRNEERVKLAKELKRKNGVGVTDGNTEKAGSYEELMAKSTAASSQFGTAPQNKNNTSIETSNCTGLGQQSRRAYLSTLRRVINMSDVILQILDSRDPLGTRASQSIENALLSNANKRVVLVLNKIDLIPRDTVSQWLTILRRSLPTVALKAGLSGGGNGSIGEGKGTNALNGTVSVGMEGLLGLLKNYCRVLGGGKSKKGCITVGIVGYPNVGKSSIINSLKRARAVGVSSRPGFTTNLQEVVLDKNIRLIDSPGVVFDDTVTTGDVLLRNCVDPDTLPDPIAAISSLIKRCNHSSLLMTYAIPDFGDSVDMFLGMVAKKYGRVGKGGIPDKIAAAKMVLKDWNLGKVPYFTPPPPLEEHSERVVESKSAVIVSEFGAEFDIAKMDETLMNSLGDDGKDEMDFVQMENSNADIKMRAKEDDKVVAALMNNDDDDAEMEDESMGGDDVTENLAKNNASCFLSNSKLAEAEDYDFGSL